MMWILSSLAFGGYGDAIDGRPSHIEREVHFWTNMVRVDPSYFSSDYPCSFSSFTSSEQSPKWPLQWNHGLGEAARVHSADMDQRNYFSHDTLGGASFSTRVWSYYSGGAIGENIAQGYSSAYSAVVQGWMCSSGHRSNIMATSFDELGTGVSSDYYTQDFGGGNPPVQALAMGIHLPENPSGTVDLGVDWTLDVAPDAIYAVLDGERYDLDAFIGDPAGWSGWAAEVSVGAGCHEYYFVGEAGGVVQTFPEDGSYTFGGCANDDPEAGWVDRQLAVGEDEEETGSTTGDDDPTDDDDPTTDEDDDGGDDDPTTDDDDDDDEGGDDDDEQPYGAEASPGGCSTAGTSGGMLAGLTVWMALAGRRRR